MNEGTIKLIEKNGKWKAEVCTYADLENIETIWSPYHATKERAFNAGVKILRERMLEDE